MRISIALATYNGGRFLREQLGSLLGQTYQPFELIVRDDGSTDNTLAILESFAAIAPFSVTILDSDERLGFENNFLRAAEACSGDFIAFCDQDDIWLPNKLAVCADRLLRDRSCIALHTMTLINEDGAVTGHWGQDITHDAMYEALDLDPYHTGWGNSMVFARRFVHLIENAKRPHQPEYPRRSMSHDTWVYTIAAAFGRVSHIAAPLILYRQHSNNAAGVSAWTPEPRLSKTLRLPLYRWREQAKSSFALAALFEEAEDPQAQRAAQIYRHRANLLTMRGNIFEDPTIAMRYLAYRTFNSVATPRPSRSSKLKAFALGVLGFGRIVHRY